MGNLPNMLQGEINLNEDKRIVKQMLVTIKEVNLVLLLFKIFPLFQTCTLPFFRTIENTISTKNKTEPQVDKLLYDSTPQGELRQRAGLLTGAFKNANFN